MLYKFEGAGACTCLHVAPADELQAMAAGLEEINTRESPVSMVVLEPEHVSGSPGFSFSRSGVGPKICVSNTFSDSDAGVGVEAENHWPVLSLRPYLD